MSAKAHSKAGPAASKSGWAQKGKQNSKKTKKTKTCKNNARENAKTPQQKMQTNKRKTTQNKHKKMTKTKKQCKQTHKANVIKLNICSVYFNIFQYLFIYVYRFESIVIYFDIN